MFRGDVGVSTPPHSFGFGRGPHTFTQVNLRYEVLMHSQEEHMSHSWSDMLPSKCRAILIFGSCCKKGL